MKRAGEVLTVALDLVRGVKPLEQTPDDVARRLEAIGVQVEAALAAVREARQLAAGAGATARLAESDL